MIPELTGYADRFSVAPGEQIRFMVSTDRPNYDVAIVRLIHGDANPAGPGFKEEVIDTPVNRQYNGRKQIAYVGSYVYVTDNPALAGLSSLTLQAWIYPTTPQKAAPQGLITRWSPAHGAGYGLVIGEQGDLGLWLGDGSRHIEQFYTGHAMRASQWYFVAATYDADNGRVCLYQQAVANWPVDSTSIVTENSTEIRLTASHPSRLLVAAAYAETVEASRVVGRGLYNGKVDSPRLFSRALTRSEIDLLKQDVSPASVAGDALIAAWDFAATLTDMSSDKVTDLGPHGLHGVAVNMPARASTGHNWSSMELDYKHALAEYGAIHFHDDDLQDAEWQVDFTLTVPDHLKSGMYAARLTAGDLEDHIPFIVRPPRNTATASVVFLCPTMTYLAYANQRIEILPEHIAAVTDREIQLDPRDHFLAEHPEFGKSIYDLHTDGTGCCYSSRLRPIISMRPKYRYWLESAPRHLGGDLYLIDWLETKGIAYDVVTDEDLHYEGVELLAHYRVVITGSHPEYWTTPMESALEKYLASGGRTMYLGGNGFYWVTGVDSARPEIIEVRRGYAGSRDWTSAMGECYLSTTGEMGGLWRHRGKAPNKLVGIGFTAMGWDGRAPGFTRKPDSYDPRVAFIFAGIGKDEIIGNFGLALGGTAGDELDRIDFGLGTPPHTLLLASSSGHSKFILPVIEDYNQINSAFVLNDRPNVRADIAYFETPKGGAVFSAGAITWFGGLSYNNYDNNVSRITENVLRRFMS